MNESTSKSTESNRPLNLTSLAAAISIALLTCGSSPVLMAKDSDGLSTPSVPSAARNTMFALSSARAAVGVALESNGWVTQVVSLRDVPNDKSTILYINAHDYAKDESLVDFIAGFRGVLIVDSYDMKDPAVRIDKAGESSLESFGSKAVSTAANAYLELSKGVSGALGNYAPDGTAVIISMNKGSFRTVDMQSNGTINGVEVGEMKEVFDLSLVVEENRLAEARNGFSSDAVVDIGPQLFDGWWAAGRVYVNGRRTGDGRWFVETYVHTGDANIVCLVNGKKCGIYPNSEADVFHTWTDGNWYTIGWAQNYSAYATVGRATQLAQLVPGKDAWGTTEFRENGQYEETYYTGMPFKLNGWNNPYTFVDQFLGALFGSSRTQHRRIFNTWQGHDRLGEPATITNGTQTVAALTSESGVVLKAEHNKIHRGFEASFWQSSESFERLLRTKSLTQSLSSCDTNRLPRKTNMAFEGWQPSFTSVFEVPARSVTFSGTGSVAVDAGLKWRRQMATYRWAGTHRCGGTGYRNGAWVASSGDIDGVIDPGAQALAHYRLGKVILIAHNRFN